MKRGRGWKRERKFTKIPSLDEIQKGETINPTPQYNSQPTRETVNQPQKSPHRKKLKTFTAEQSAGDLYYKGGVVKDLRFWHHSVSEVPTKNKRCDTISAGLFRNSESQKREL